jgi:hypothetical protein
MLGVDRRLSLTLPNINSSVSLFLLPPEPPRQLRGLRRKGIILFYYIIPLSLVYIIGKDRRRYGLEKEVFPSI